MFDFFEKKSSRPNDTPLLTKEAAQSRLTVLKQKASFAADMAGLGKQKARVVLALDASGSMSSLYRNGVIQRLCERILALGVKFDDNRAVDVFLFDTNHRYLGEIKENNFYEFSTHQVIKSYDNMGGGTCYAGVIKHIAKKYTSERGDPAYIMFVTDGDNSDHREAESVIRDASRHAIFWQFIGIGGSRFSFLEKLDTMPGRFIDNANFFAINDLDRIDDGELYKRLFHEFPSWLGEAKKKSLF